MPCSHVRIGGATAIICGPKRIPTCSSCGSISTRMCDWKLARNKTCDRRLCDACTYQPANDKDLCPEHRRAWEQHPRNLFRGTERQDDSPGTSGASALGRPAPAPALRDTVSPACSTAPEGALRNHLVGMGSDAAAIDHAPPQLEQQHP